MINNQIEFFTDASFDPKTKTAVVGYMTNNTITTQIINNTTNTQAELLAIMLAVEIIDVDQLYVIYTDCKTAVDLQLKPRYNKDIYTDLLKIFQTYPNLKLEHLEGHKKSADKTDLDRKFAILDKYVRKQLRLNR